ncbi:flagellar hook assembly protein FlgD [Paeniglutamicibacter sp. R2-26]|uniref:flagellar hook assembly protein FlgD n=1 Tax=Paeniglutamicibacter sp. R2-26 TaxID=3144417 RepID=UPI003EE4D060
MTVAPIDASQFGAGTQSVRAPKQTMDGEVFMHLLVTQLANQDPSSPMDTNEMIAQTTQLASMEKLDTLSSTQNVSLAIQQRTAVAGLIGQQVTTAGKDGITGVVTAVSFAGLEPMLTVDGKQVPYGSVETIRPVPEGATDPGTDPAPDPGPEQLPVGA